MAFGGELRRGDSPSILEHFAGLGAELYAGDPHPGVRSAAATLALVEAGNPTRRRCQLMAFLADGPSARGRVAAIINPHLVDEDGRPYGLLGFFECRDHEDTARRLIDLGLEWLDRQGCRVVRGPINFTTFHDYRLVTSSAAAGWIPGEPYHPDYYPRLWRAAGMAPVTSYSSNWLPHEMLEALQPSAEASRAAGYTIRHLAGAADLEALYQLSTVSFAQAWMYSPITREEFAALYGADRVAKVASSTYLVHAADGAPVGFLYGFPVELDGRTATVCKSIAVLPEHRAGHPYQLLLHTWFREQYEAGIRDFVGGLMHRDGAPGRLGWTTPETCLREYEVYERQL